MAGSAEPSALTLDAAAGVEITAAAGAALTVGSAAHALPLNAERPLLAWASISAGGGLT